MNDQNQWVAFGSKNIGFAYHPGERRRADFKRTVQGWDSTLELEAPEAANQEILEHLYTRTAEKTLEPLGRDAKELFQDIPAEMLKELTALLTGAVDASSFMRQAKWP